MIKRTILEKLRAWKVSQGRKPLILRGVRQVGKTTVVTEFAKEYDTFLHLNLERESDRKLFEQTDDVEQLIRSIYMHKRQVQKEGTVLLFIDLTSPCHLLHQTKRRNGGIYLATSQSMQSALYRITDKLRLIVTWRNAILL